MNSFPQKTTIKILLSPGRKLLSLKPGLFNLSAKCTIFSSKNANFIADRNAFYEK